MDNFIINRASLYRVLLNSTTNSKYYFKQPLEVFYQKAGLKYFALFTGKHLRWSAFLLKMQGRRHVRHLHVQSQQWQQLRKMWNLVKVNKKDTRKTLETSLCHFIGNFEHISQLFVLFLLLLWTGNFFLGVSLW